MILVTDDVKEDWWDKKPDGSYILRQELIQEFEKTGQQIFPYTSHTFFEAVGEDYHINVPDMVQCALELTDEGYCERIADKVFDKIVSELTYNGQCYIDEDSSNIGSLGIDEFEIESYDYLSGEQANREEDDVYYVLEFYVKLSGYSHEYFGRDDEYLEDAYNTCPKCGKSINFQNDAGNGFCIECTRNEE